MADIFVPGNKLEEARQALGFVQDHIDIGNNTFDFDRAFGPELSRGSAQNFENKWEEGKKQLLKEVKGIKEAMDQIMDSFQKTDQDAASNLDVSQEGGKA